MELFDRYYAELSENKKLDDDSETLWNNLLAGAIDYTNIRAKWSLMTNEERASNDSLKTKLHNSFIDRLNIYKRYICKQGIKLLSDELTTKDRKTIGDFANYLVYKEAVGNK